MRPIPGTITDPRVDRILYKSEPKPDPKPIRLTVDQAQILRGLARYAATQTWTSPDEKEAIAALSDQL